MLKSKKISYRGASGNIYKNTDTFLFDPAIALLRLYPTQSPT